MLKFVKMILLGKLVKVEEKEIGKGKWKVKSMIKKIKSKNRISWSIKNFMMKLKR